MINFINLFKRVMLLNKKFNKTDNKWKYTKDLSTPASKEFEQLLNSQLSKTKIEEGKSHRRQNK